MTKVRTQIPPLSPGSARHPSGAAHARMRLRRRRGAPGPSTGRQRHRAFLEGFAHGGIATALDKSGMHMGQAILDWIAHPDFRRALERIGAERLAAAEHRLVDRLLQQLDAPDANLDKVALAIWQQLKDDRRRPAARADTPKATAPRRRHTIPPERAQAAAQHIHRRQGLNQLLDSIRARLNDAEASKGAELMMGKRSAED